MDKGTQSLLNVLLSVLAPVMVLDHCSVAGPELWQLGTAKAMCVALMMRPQTNRLQTLRE